MPIKLKHKEQVEEQETDLDYAMRSSQKPALIHVILLNRPLQLLVMLFIFGIILPVLVYLIVYSREIGPLQSYQRYGNCGHSAKYHVPCGNVNITRDYCEKRGCCYLPSTADRASLCYHTLPAKHQYRITDKLITAETVAANLSTELSITPLGVEAFSKLKLSIRGLSDARLRIRLWNPDFDDMADGGLLPPATASYKFKILSPLMYIEVRRKDNDALLLTTSRGALIATENYFEWSVFLGTDLLYGLGELILEPGFKKLLMNTETQNSAPFILAFNATNQQYHGLYFSAPYPVEVEITESKLIILRALFDYSFYVELFVGPSISHVVEQMNEMTSFHYTIPYWGYGLHICSNSSINMTQAITELNDLLDTEVVSTVPFDSHCLREHLIWLTDDYSTFSGAALIALGDLKNASKKFIAPIMAQLIVGSNEPFKRALSDGLLLRKENSNTFYDGLMANRTVAYLDWVAADETKILSWVYNYWPYNLTDYYISPDGYLLQSNWMSDESADGENINVLDLKTKLVYIPDDFFESIRQLTPWSIRLTDANSSILLHSYNLMGPAQVESIKQFLQEMKDDKFLISESSSPMTMVTTSIRNVKSTWTDLRSQVRQTLINSICGMPFSGTNICGDSVTSDGTFIAINEELCIRWYQFAALTPVFKVSHEKSPIKFSKQTQKLIISAIRMRYSMLGYYNTILSSGQPLIAPMFYEFPHLTNETENFVEQFLIGKALLAAPVLLPTVSQVNIYFPDLYFELGGGQRMTQNWTIWSVVQSDIPLFIRAGYILPVHHSSNSLSAVEARKEPINLIVALNCTNTTFCQSDGELFIQENQQWTFTANHEKINITFGGFTMAHYNILCGNNDDKQMTSVIQSIKLYGLPSTLVSSGNVNFDVNFDVCLEGPLPMSREFRYPI